jgi:hypothetical protein
MNNNKNFITYIYVVLFIVFGFLVSITISTCTKESTAQKVDQEVTMRSGGALIFYQSSLTMDNRLIVPAQDSIRRHTIFNKEKIENVIYNASGLGIADVFGTVCRHYNITINFKDGTELFLIAYALDSGEDYEQDVSTCLQVLKPSYNASMVEIERLNTQEKKYNLWLDQTRLLNHVLIKKDGVITGKYLMDPLEYPQIQFSPKHIH